jgi:hypothetical protein
MGKEGSLRGMSRGPRFAKGSAWAGARGGVAGSWGGAREHQLYTV